MEIATTIPFSARGRGTAALVHLTKLESVQTTDLPVVVLGDRRIAVHVLHYSVRETPENPISLGGA